MIGLEPLVRRFVAQRVRQPQLVDDLVQETLTRVMAAQDRVERDSLAPYAVTTARNLIASTVQKERRAKDRAHLLVEPEATPPADGDLLREEETSLVGSALAHLSPSERSLLLAHEVDGEEVAALATKAGTTPGAVAAQLSRARAKLRVEYLLAQEGSDPPTDRCRPVLRALSLGERRRMGELDAYGHLLACDHCASVGARLLHRTREQRDDEARVTVRCDADVVTARQKGREVAARAGLSGADLTLIATAISEVTRNIVKFANRGEIRIFPVSEHDRVGVRVVARDAGPGIPDVGLALEDGYSTYSGLGLGLPGCRRLMDAFEIVSDGNKGTTVTMTKWR